MGVAVVAWFGGRCGPQSSSRLATALVLWILDVRCTGKRVGGQGWMAEHTKLGEKGKKKKIWTCTKNMIGSLCCACAVDTWAGGLRGWFEASSTQWNLAERNVEIAQCWGINMELPLQVGGHRSFHGDGAVMPAHPCHGWFCVTFLQEWGCQQRGVVTEVRTGQDTAKKRSTHFEREGNGRQRIRGDRGDTGWYDWSGTWQWHQLILIAVNLRHVSSEVGVLAMRVVAEVKSGQDMAKKKVHLLGVGKATHRAVWNRGQAQLWGRDPGKRDWSGYGK